MEFVDLVKKAKMIHNKAEKCIDCPLSKLRYSCAVFIAEADDDELIKFEKIVSEWDLDSQFDCSKVKTDAYNDIFQRGYNKGKLEAYNNLEQLLVKTITDEAEKILKESE